MKDLILTAKTWDEFAAFFDHRLDLALQRYITQNTARPDTIPGEGLFGGRNRVGFVCQADASP